MWVRVPRFQNIKYNQYAFLINHINIILSKKKKSISLKYSKKVLRLSKLLSELGFIKFYIYKSGFNKLLKLTVFLYKSSTFFNVFRQVTTPSKKFTIGIKSLLILTQSIGNSVIIIESAHGLITHKKAIQLGVGGAILCILS